MMSESDKNSDISKLLNTIVNLLDETDENATTTITPSTSDIIPKPSTYNYFERDNVQACYDCNVKTDDVKETLYYVIGILLIATLLSLVVLIVVCCQLMVCKTKQKSPTNVIITQPVSQPFGMQHIPYNNFAGTNPKRLPITTSWEGDTIPQPATYYPPKMMARINQYPTTM